MTVKAALDLLVKEREDALDLVARLSAAINALIPLQEGPLLGDIVPDDGAIAEANARQAEPQPDPPPTVKPGLDPVRCRWCDTMRDPRGIRTHERHAHPTEYQAASITPQRPANTGGRPKTGSDIGGKTFTRNVTPAPEPRQAAPASAKSAGQPAPRPPEPKRPNPIERSPMAGKGAFVPSGLKTRFDENAARRAAFGDPETLG